MAGPLKVLENLKSPMNPSEKQKQIDLEKEKNQFKELEKERELKRQRQRLEEHREQLRQQMFLRSDYYELGLTHKLLIGLLLIFLLGFVGLLILTYIPATKKLASSFMNLFL